MSTSRKAIGIDFGGTTIKSAVVQDGRLIAHGDTIDTQVHSGSQSLIDEMLGVIAALRDEHSEIEAVGVGLPGFVDSINGIVHELTTVPGWHEVPLRSILAERPGLTAIIENDAKAMAYGEWKYGAARGMAATSFASRSAPASEGRSSWTAAFIGAPSSEPVKSGIPASITKASRDGITIRATSRSSWEITRSPCARTRFISPPDATSRWRDAHRWIYSRMPRVATRSQLDLWDDIGIELGCALTNTIWLLNPDVIVIGGGVAKAGDLLFNPIIRTVRERTVPLIHQQLRIVPAELGNEAGIIGNATLALEAAHPA